MALWIGNQISGSDGLFYATKEGLESKGAKVYMNSPVESIDFDAKTVTALVDGKEHVESYDKLILATGSQPASVPLPVSPFNSGTMASIPLQIRSPILFFDSRKKHACCRCEKACWNPLFDFAVFQRVGNKVFDTFAHLLAVIDEVVSLGSCPNEHIKATSMGIMMVFLIMPVLR